MKLLVKNLYMKEFNQHDKFTIEVDRTFNLLNNVNTLKYITVKGLKKKLTFLMNVWISWFYVTFA